MTTTVNAFASVPGGEHGYKLTQTREQNARPLVEKAYRQYERGLLSVQDLIQMLAEVESEVFYAHGQAVANHVLGLIVRDAALGEGVPQPKVYEPGFHAPTWTIGWEEGPYEWPLIFQAKDYCLPAHVEALNHWCLAVYPNT